MTTEEGDLRNGTGDFNRSPRQLRCEGEICIQILTDALNFIGFSLLVRTETLEEMLVGRIARFAFAAAGEQLRCECVVLVQLLSLQFSLQFEFPLVCDAFHEESLVNTAVIVGGQRRLSRQQRRRQRTINEIAKGESKNVPRESAWLQAWA